MERPRSYPVDPAFAAYTRAETLADGFFHVVGVATALLSVPVLVTLSAVWYGEAPIVGAAVVYGLSLIVALTASACYNLSSSLPARRILRRLDHAAIYLKIAGTYTPFTVLLAGSHAPAILTGIWCAALLGMAVKLAAPGRIERVSLVLYVAMGWAVVVIGDPILDAVSPTTFLLMLTGGGLYMLGIVFFLSERLPYHNAIWHGFVLAASSVFYAAILIEVSRNAPGA